MKKFDFGKNTKKTTVIDCLDCENYYTGACDGNAGGCNAYEPTRKITLEKDIREIKSLCRSTAILVLGAYLAYFVAALSVLFAR